MDTVQLGTDRVIGDVEDIELVREAAYGNGSAFGSLYERYSPRVYTFCYRLLGDRSKAGEATEQAFVKTAKKLVQIRRLPPNDLCTQLFLNAYHASLVGLEDQATGEHNPTHYASHGAPPPRQGEDIGDLGWQERISIAHESLGIDQRAALGLATLQRANPQIAGHVLHLGAAQASRLLSTARIALASVFQSHGIPPALDPDCQHTLELLATAPHRGDMEPEERTWLDRHTSGCAACSQSMRLAPLGSALSADIAWEIPPPALRHASISGAALALGANWASIAGPQATAKNLRQESSPTEADTGTHADQVRNHARVLLGRGKELVASRALSGKGAGVSLTAAGLVCAASVALALVGSGRHQASKPFLPPATSAIAPAPSLPPPDTSSSSNGVAATDAAAPKSAPVEPQPSHTKTHHPIAQSQSPLPQGPAPSHTDNGRTQTSQGPKHGKDDSQAHPKQAKHDPPKLPEATPPPSNADTGDHPQGPGDQTDAQTSPAPSESTAGNTGTDDSQGSKADNSDSSQKDSQGGSNDGGDSTGGQQDH
jgi:DNA-directed RNA polymerase specialized sigma24 family protein